MFRFPCNSHFPTVEECDFEGQFLFDEYVAISHRYDLKIIEKLNNCSFGLCKLKLNCFATFMMRDSLLDFHSVFFLFFF
jgi:hypothetical protein